MNKYHRYALGKAGSWVLIQGFRKIYTEFWLNK